MHEFSKSETGAAIKERIQCIFDGKYTKKEDVDLKKLRELRNAFDDSKNGLKPTLYYEDEDAVDENAGKIAKDTFCKVRIIFPLEKTLEEFEDILRSNLRDETIKEGKLTLHYVEGTLTIRSMSYILCFCSGERAFQICADI